MEKIKYGGWDNCYKITDGYYNLVVTSDVGPRVIHFSLENDINMFKQIPEQLGKVGSSEWLAYGGHRLWIAPEHPQRSYFPDNQPVQVEEIADGLRCVAQIEQPALVQKILEIRIGNGTVSVDHQLVNKGPSTLSMAAWALSVMASGGTAVIPFPQRGPHPQYLLPASSIVLWKFTDMRDPRWSFGQRYLQAQQDPRMSAKQKLGFFAPDGWMAYANLNQVFIKYSQVKVNETYPDLGCNMEVYVDGEIIELETLSPLYLVEPGGSITHHETWKLVGSVPLNTSTIENIIFPIAEGMVESQA